MVDFRALNLMNHAKQNMKAILKASKETPRKGLDTEIHEKLIDNEIQKMIDNIVEAAKGKTLESIRVNGLPTQLERNHQDTIGQYGSEENAYIVMTLIQMKGFIDEALKETTNENIEAHMDEIENALSNIGTAIERIRKQLKN
jgi:hypothetical protein